MAVLSGDYTGNSILIYDDAGSHLGSTVVTRHDKTVLRIELLDVPPLLTVGSCCRLLILSSPSPCEYHGRVRKEGLRTYIAMYQGHERENRSAVRYKISCPALIENLICDDHPYSLHTPLEIMLIDISKIGVRFGAPRYSLSDGDRFQMRMKISDTEKILIASVVHHIDIDSGSSEYGCRFLIGSEKAV